MDASDPSTDGPLSTVQAGRLASSLFPEILERKRCTRCHEIKKLPEFVRASDKRDGYTNLCKTCRTAGDRARYTTERGRANYFKVKYGITLEQYDELLEKQEGRCAICGATNAGNKRPLGAKWTGKPRPEGHGNKLYVDHDHDTGEVRALLCNRCNRGLGAFEDDRERLLTAQRFLDAWDQFKESREGDFSFRGWAGD